MVEHSKKEVQTGGTWKQDIIHCGLFLLSAFTYLIDLSNIQLCGWKGISFLLVKQSIEQQNNVGRSIRREKDRKKEILYAAEFTRDSFKLLDRRRRDKQLRTTSVHTKFL